MKIPEPERLFQVITICGSTRFKDEFIEAAKELTLSGWIVLTCNLFNHADNLNITEHQKQMLDRMHKQKIWMSDAIYVINKDGYIGESTHSEIRYALLLGKKIFLHHPEYELPDFSPLA